MQGLVWGEPELAHEHDYDVENNRKFEVCGMQLLSLLFVGDLVN